MLLSFYIFVALIVMMFFVSIYDKKANEKHVIVAVNEKPGKGVIIAWAALAVVMIALYVFFNGN